ncbi:glycosyltransferase [Herbiconiux sp. KACC 21604]|uniref:glycosyltransferase n=1 Tax=unclassified Herbiconiux TaxID=2618217 RepID=UPI00149249E3|nr:glycosyltransferase [Herbiconiux sp. SALV-R1]QJU55459.1 glycosyltransferase [Herbiconiux sp. SALV-R1]WPO86642.1 glycosyltransferase [Herbiconiux sp. KACC 21604]
MRIALVSLHTSPLALAGSGDAGGMNTFLLGVADALVAAGHEVELLTRATDARPGTPDALRTPGGAVVRFLEAGPRASVPKGELAALAPAFADALRALPPFDVVHSNYWLSGLAALPVAEEWGVPHVLSLHTVAALKNARLAPGDTPEPSSRLDGERMLVRASALTVTHTAAEREAVVELLGAEPTAVVTVPPGVDTELFHPGDATPGRPVVAVLARIQPLKGVDLAIEALARIPSASRPRLVIAGGVSPGHDDYAHDLLSRTRELGLEGDIEFLPAQERAAAAELLRDAALLLVPSFSETFGLVALEAAASGTPVVAARTTGLLDAVSDGESGVLLDGRDPALWAATISGLLADPARLAALSTSAVAFAARHTWRGTAVRLAGLYSAAVAARIARAAFGDSPVFLHAHPDDESISTGGAIAAVVRAGGRATVLTGTRGERGEVVPGPLHALEGTPRLAPHREGELRAALAELALAGDGTLAHAYLGGRRQTYADSGMRWGDDGFAVAAADAPADALSLAPLEDVVADVVTALEELGVHPSSIVSYDARGGYGHPDHVRMHDAALVVAARLGVPFFAVTEPRVDGGDGPEPPATEVRLELGALCAAKARAMAAHATQLTLDDSTEPPHFVLSGGQRHPLGVIEGFRREETDTIVQF